MAAKAGRPPKELTEAPKLPPHAAHVWGYFAELHSTRKVGAWGVPEPITRDEIRSWEHDERIQLQRWERKALLAVDLAFRAQAAKTAAKSK